jgi:Zn finger protein HypA/HybF involved in hydrogenase expression
MDYAIRKTFILGKVRIENILFSGDLITQILLNTMFKQQEIKCKECGAVYPFETLNSLKLFNMLCPKCKKGNCKIEHVKVDLPTVDKKT